MIFVVYSIKNMINDKLYVGITNNVGARWNKHIYDAKHDSSCVIHRAIRKYGENNIAGTNISKVCRGKKKTAGGYRWQYCGENNA